MQLREGEGQVNKTHVHEWRAFPTAKKLTELREETRHHHSSFLEGGEGNRNPALLSSRPSWEEPHRTVRDGNDRPLTLENSRTME